MDTLNFLDLIYVREGYTCEERTLVIKFCSCCALAAQMDIQQTASRKTAQILYACNSEMVILFSAQVEPYNWIFYSRASQSFSSTSQYM